MRTLRRWLDKFLGRAVVEDTRLPHEKYPELLEWEQGDSIRLEITLSTDFPYTRMSFRAMTEDGYIYLSGYGEVYKYRATYLMRYARNQSLQDRRLSQEIRDSPEYMELIRNFQEALRELRARR